MPKFHAIFVFDKSGSMSLPSLDMSKRKISSLKKDRVGDVIETGIYEFLKIR